MNRIILTLSFLLLALTASAQTYNAVGIERTGTIPAMSTNGISGGGGAQTPWTNNIDGNGKSLTNVINIPIIVTNYELLSFQTNVPTQTLWTPASHTLYEVSAVLSMAGGATQTNTVTIMWRDDQSNSNTVNLIDHVIKSTSGSINAAPYTFIAANAVTISFSVTIDGANANNNVRICLKELK